jgi:hypothetical protein
MMTEVPVVRSASGRICAKVATNLWDRNHICASMLWISFKIIIPVATNRITTDGSHSIYPEIKQLHTLIQASPVQEGHEERPQTAINMKPNLVPFGEFG